MSNSKTLHLKYRPRNLDEVVGQDVTVKILKNAILNDRVPNAFLFTGSRGLGKTSLARIMAKSINCKARIGYNPCNACGDCERIGHSNHIDIVEMDAASKTGIDDVRLIIESAHYMPIGALHKVYIIDEAHMLSSGAFNALLKTLEESPPGVKFIFATTERRKIPATIVSRCQNFRLGRATPVLLCAHLRRIADLEGIPIDDDAILCIARSASGSIRDGISLLEQAAILGNGDLMTRSSVLEMLGIPDDNAAKDLLALVMAGDCRNAIIMIDALYYEGCSMSALFEQVLVAINDIMRTMYSDIGSMTKLSRVWDLALKARDDLNRASEELCAAQVAVVRMVVLSSGLGHYGCSPGIVETNDLCGAPSMACGVASEAVSTQVLSTPASVDCCDDKRAQICILLDRADREGELIVAYHLRSSVDVDSILDDEVRVKNIDDSDLKVLVRCLSSWTNRGRSARMSGGSFTTYEQLASDDKARMRAELLTQGTSVTSELISVFGLSNDDISF